ncbi:MAG: hypothetical protein AAGK04_07450 [Planctomycetota bacterium]
MIDATSTASEAVVRGNYAVARKALDSAKEQGDAAVELIRAAGEVGNPSNGSVAPATKTAAAAGRLDVTA